MIQQTAVASGPTSTDAVHDVASRSRVARQTPGRRGLRPAVAMGTAFLVYLAISVALWWHVWSTHPTSVDACGCNDPALFLWFIEWPAYALAHGHNPFYSTAIFHSTGIDLLSNTSVLAIGIPLAPVTWLFGPVATLNVASTAGPALSALAMFWLLGRWVGWRPAAFLGGLVYGFSPFVVDNLAVAHLMTAVLVLVPLMVACLDELLVRQRGRPAVTGVALGLLVVLQFFLGTEILVIIAMCTVVALVVLTVYAALRDRHDLARRLPHAIRGLVVAIAVAVVLLAYPLWFAFAGPAHLSGLVWPNLKAGSGGIVLSDLWKLRFMSPKPVRLFGGYEGPAVPENEYLGLGMLVVLAAGVLAWRRDRRLWFFGGMALITIVLSLGVENSYWVPWRVLARIPVVQNVIPGRVMAMTLLCIAVMLGVIIDRSYHSVRRLESRLGARRLVGRSAGLGRCLAALCALAVAAVAVVPMGTALASNIPLTTEPLTLPPWFARVAPTLPKGQVVLAYPPPVSGASAMAWQAVDRFQFALATGTGPESIPSRAGTERQGLAVITAASAIFSKPVPASAENVDALRHALAGWGVTMVVVPEPAVLVPRYDRAASTAQALGLFTLAIGRRPSFTAGAWVWSDVQMPARPLSVSTPAFGRCTSAAFWQHGAEESVPDCVFAHSSART